MSGGKHWRDDALCRQIGPDMFFPPRGGDHEAITAAKKVCDRCPVRTHCLDLARTVLPAVGIWAGIAAHTFPQQRGAA